jgi:hypothetical protein
MVPPLASLHTTTQPTCSWAYRGLVDFKVAAIDQTWSGLRFARKKPSK